MWINDRALILCYYPFNRNALFYLRDAGRPRCVRTFEKRIQAPQKAVWVNSSIYFETQTECCDTDWVPSLDPLPSEASSALFTRSPLLQKRDYPVTNSVSHSNKVRQQYTLWSMLEQQNNKSGKWQAPPSCLFLVVNSGECNLCSSLFMLSVLQGSKSHT